MNELSGQKFRLLRTGGLGLLRAIIKITKIFSPGKTDLYPGWQGMQYMRNMTDERAALNTIDNNRYADMTWVLLQFDVLWATSIILKLAPPIFSRGIKHCRKIASILFSKISHSLLDVMFLKRR